ncbi:pentapeptide repeat-containing protein [Chamaesiphon minutus]|uniref:Putative low-complexity protein n=1 Tax=Chamaesiphon minutus (strain ATCC 27169 / PCC 6605) TaxID=1173020 RepID=K9UIL0_CHAP6|nr:pentapeptide repeat-containing protein [Chamaesiphon minutus]AFY94044.1 putative low-complexity protein [Chamaesiphon minutus PCC 6605]
MKLSFRRTIAGYLLTALLVVVSLFMTSIYPSAALADDFTKATLENADFSGKDLTSYEFTQASVRNGKFINANLTGVSLIGGNFDSADMTGANLTNALLDTARFTRTNFTNAILVGAFTSVTNFDGAIIDGADFTDVLLRKDIQKKLCKVAKGTNPTTGRDTRESLECP